MRAELLMIGTELLIGQIEDTNSTFMSRVLAEHGIHCYQKTTVGDNRDRINAALNAALERCDVVLCSGGLGPTEDDITRECVADVMGVRLEYHEELFEAIRRRFARIGRSVTGNNKKQALLPEGAEAIENPHGTAPGLWADTGRGFVVCMPGVPFELKPMLVERVIPRLREVFGMTGVLRYRVLKVCGVGESRIDAVMGDLINSQVNPTVGLLANPESVKIRIAAHGRDEDDARARIAPVEEEVRRRLPGLIMGAGEDTLEGVVCRLLRERHWTLAVGETGTGGMIAQRLTAAGSTAFAGGRVWPVEAGFPRDEETAIDLAGRLLLDCKADCALVLLYLPRKQRSSVVFRTPEGDHFREVGQYGTGARGQVRTSVWALEQVRRILAGETNAEPGEVPKPLDPR